MLLHPRFEATGILAVEDWGFFNRSCHSRCSFYKRLRVQSYELMSEMQKKSELFFIFCRSFFRRTAILGGGDAVLVLEQAAEVAGCEAHLLGDVDNAERLEPSAVHPQSTATAIYNIRHIPFFVCLMIKNRLQGTKNPRNF